MGLRDLCVCLCGGSLVVAIVAVGAFLGLSYTATSRCALIDGSAIGDGLSGAARCEYDFGFGLLTASYEGGLVDGRLHGQGLYTAGSSSYTGGFRHNKRHGDGTLRLADGSEYEGGFVANQFDGEGTFRAGPTSPQLRHTQVASASYTGEWEGGCMEGSGLARVPLGYHHAEYEGGFKRCVPDGDGGTLRFSHDLLYTLTAVYDVDNGTFVVDANNVVVTFRVKCMYNVFLMQPPSCAVSVRDTPCDSAQCVELRDAMGRFLLFSDYVLLSGQAAERAFGYVWGGGSETLSAADLPRAEL